MFDPAIFDPAIFDPKEFTQATDQQLDDLAALVGHPLPAAYRAAMRAGTGSTMVQMMGVGEMEADLAGILRAAPRHAKDYALPGVWPRLKNDLPKGWMPFARSSGGEWFCLDLKAGRIALYVPDLAPDEGAMDEADLIAVAANLPDFVAMLAPFEL